MNLPIIGGSYDGISAALRARELDPRTAITVLPDDDLPNSSICGLPLYLSGETPDWRFQGMTVDQMSDVSSPWIPVQMACRAWSVKFATEVWRSND